MFRTARREEPWWIVALRTQVHTRSGRVVRLQNDGQVWNSTCAACHNVIRWLDCRQKWKAQSNAKVSCSTLCHARTLPLKVVNLLMFSRAIFLDAENIWPNFILTFNRFVLDANQRIDNSVRQWRIRPQQRDCSENKRPHVDAASAFSSFLSISSCFRGGQQNIFVLCAQSFLFERSEILEFFFRAGIYASSRPYKGLLCFQK